MSTLAELAARPWPWWVAGPAIGLFATTFAAVTGKAVAVSGGFGAVCARAFPRLSFFQRSSFAEGWRVLFLLGMPVGGWMGATLMGHSGVVVSMGLFDTVVSSRMDVKLAFLFAGGLMVGFGARWAGGCTSGHSIMGIAQGHKASVVATIGFMAGGVLTAQLLFRLWGGR
jgi:uncharacterized membrane protein YedE/YeeE